MRHRGLTFITVLVVIGGVALVGWIVTYGPAYWDNVEVGRILKQAANLCYREAEDGPVIRFVFNELHRDFDEEVEENGRVEKRLSIDVDPADLRIERTTEPKYVHIWLTYHRTITVPLLGQQRELTFVDHAEQDLSPVKW